MQPTIFNVSQILINLKALNSMPINLKVNAVSCYPCHGKILTNSHLITTQNSNDSEYSLFIEYSLFHMEK